jgi:hypothetical protein
LIVDSKSSTMTNVQQNTMSRPSASTSSAFGTIKTSDKADEEFRVYSEEKSPPRVIQHYKDMRRFHTVAFYRKMEEKFTFENGVYRRLMTVDEAFDELEHYVVSRVD